MSKLKLLRLTTVPISLNYLLKGQMAFIRQNGFKVIMGSAAGEEIEEVKKQEGCMHVVFPLTRKITPLKDILALFLLFRYLKKEKPQIVHSHTPKAGLLSMTAAYWQVNTFTSCHTSKVKEDLCLNFY